jgi:hypothetical protein
MLDPALLERLRARALATGIGLSLVFAMALRWKFTQV